MPFTRREALISAGVFATAGVLAGQPRRDEGGESTDLSRAQESERPSAKSELVCLADYEVAAKQCIPSMSWEFYHGSAADEISMRWNVEAYQRIRLKPRVLVDVSKLDTRVTLFGHEHPFPILLAPTAYHKLAHPEGELATTRGANAADATLVLSTMSTTPVEDVARAAKRPLWFQLYVQRDRGFARELVERVEAAGCQALCLTADTPVPGARNREERVEFRLPASVVLPHLRGLKVDGVEVSRAGLGHRSIRNSIYSAISDPALTWKDVEWLAGLIKVPLLVKGVLNAEDADCAVKSGAAGILVSNHGARNLDTTPATIDALPLVVERISGRVPVLVDGGVRRGTDVLKALAIGANAVLIGRPYLYGLGVAGEDGVARVVNILRREFEMAMALTGRPTIASIDRTVLWT